MNFLNKTLGKIKIIETLIIFLILYLIIILLDFSFGINIDEIWVYIGLLIYILYKIRDCTEDIIDKSKNIFNTFSFKDILFIVLLNIFFSYGMLLITNYLKNWYFDANSTYLFISSFKTLTIFTSLLSSLIIAPIFEELLFRGIFLQRLAKVFSLPFTILVISILFGLIHGFGGIISAIVFGISMCILYVKSQNILVPIFAHFLNNVFAELIVIIDSNNVIFTNPIVILILSILAIISTYFLIDSFINEFKIFKKNEVK